MKQLRAAVAGSALLAGLVLVPAAGAHASGVDLRDGAVLVQLNDGAANSIEAFARADDGSLSPVGVFGTGGAGGKQVGAPVDALASQGSLAWAGDRSTVIAVNAGSGSVSSLAVHAGGLALTSVVPSRGSFPSSVAVHGSLVFVLNAGGEGSVSGYRLDDGVLRPIPGAVRSLGLNNAAVPAFLTAPAQVGLSPDGRTLVVTTKANNTIVTFPVRGDGTLGAAKVTASAGPVPFSFVFDSRGNLEVQQAGDGRNVSYAVRNDSSLVQIGASAPSGGAALCWSVRVGSYLFGANAGSGTLTSWRLDRDGRSTLSHPVAATTAGGVIDLAAGGEGRFVYALNAIHGTVDVLANDGRGGLTPVSQAAGLPVIDADGGPEGIVAS